MSVDGYSPLLRARTLSAHPGPELGVLNRAESIRSRQSNRSRVALDKLRGFETGTQNDLPLRTSAQEVTQGQTPNGQSIHANISREGKSSLLDTEGIHGAGAGVGLGYGAGGYAQSDAHVTAELSAIYSNIQKVLDIRHKYIRLSLQGSFDNPKDDPSWKISPSHPEPAWDHNQSAPELSSMGNSTVLDKDLQSKSDENGVPKRNRKPGQDIGEDFDMDDFLPMPEADEMTFGMDSNSVYQVYENSKSADLDSPIITIPTIREFYMDLDLILDVSSGGPSKSFAFRRLQYLEGKFNLYILLNEYQETADSKRVPHRDFYNVRKVDTHVHHSACMNQKHLLRFIKSKMKKSPDEVVLYRDGRYLTLKEVFESISLTAYDLSIDTLDMHVCCYSRQLSKHADKSRHIPTLFTGLTSSI
jgi:AMP deaminase